MPLIQVLPETRSDPYKGFPKCAECGHAAAAHDGDGHADDEAPQYEGDRPQGWCLVNAHESASDAECECGQYQPVALEFVIVSKENT